VEDRVGQVWLSRDYAAGDYTHATIFVITSRHEDWVNKHTGKVLSYWVGHVLFSADEAVGRRFVWEEGSLSSGGDSYDNVYERIA